MKALLCHNFYRFAGGEDQVFRDESWLLREHGHEVISWSRHNHAIDGMGKLQLARRTIWNGEVYRELQCLIQQQAPDVVHFHNTFPLVSPAASSRPGTRVFWRHSTLISTLVVIM